MEVAKFFPDHLFGGHIHIAGKCRTYEGVTSFQILDGDQDGRMIYQGPDQGFVLAQLAFRLLSLGYVEMPDHRAILIVEFDGACVHGNPPGGAILATPLGFEIDQISAAL